MKPDDLIGAWACSACHDEIDRRTNDSRQQRRQTLPPRRRDQDAGDTAEGGED